MLSAIAVRERVFNLYTIPHLYAMKSMLMYVSLLNGKVLWQFIVLLMTTPSPMMPFSADG
jgi:hypothetical protein